jgi:hypothetical protein
MHYISATQHDHHQHTHYIKRIIGAVKSISSFNYEIFCLILVLTPNVCDSSVCGEYLLGIHGYTKFSLRCLVCSEALGGPADAQSHAKKTGHINFGEI